ncbi:MAG: thioredoxin [Parasporobacterium sp.]|nr:thioredoxin [Parasporobacterium sp.]
MKRKQIAIMILRAAAIVLGILFLVIGILRGEPGEILFKAVKICLECIGIG